MTSPDVARALVHLTRAALGGCQHTKLARERLGCAVAASAVCHHKLATFGQLTQLGNKRRQHTGFVK